MVVAKAVAIGVQGLLPIALEHVTVKVRGIVVGPPVLVEVFATEPVNPRGATFVVTTVDVITVAVGIKIIASLENEGGGPCVGRAGIGNRPERVIPVSVTIAVHPLVAHVRQTIDEVKHKVPICVAIEAEHDDVVIHFVPVGHVDRSVVVNL